MKRYQQIEKVIEELEALDDDMEILSDIGQDVYVKRKELSLAIDMHKNSLKCFTADGEEIAHIFQGALFFPRHTNCILDYKTEIIAKFLQIMLEEVNDEI